jgi:hypothetical protein
MNESNEINLDQELNLRGPMGNGILEELRERNQVRVNEIIKRMGSEWLGHKDRKARIPKAVVETLVTSESN